MKPSIFYYDPQGIAIHYELRELFLQASTRGYACGVYEGNLDKLHDYDDVLFVSIDNHPCPIPQQVENVLQAIGAKRWRIDDSACRRKHLEVHHAASRH